MTGPTCGTPWCVLEPGHRGVHSRIDRMTAEPAAEPAPGRQFVLHREVDPSGISGTGIVAEGIVHSDGFVSLRWRGVHPATAVWLSINHVIAVHGHGGLTTVRWCE